MGRITPKANLGGPPSTKKCEAPAWFRTLNPSHAEAFSHDSGMVREAKEESSSKHSYNFTTDGACDLSGTFKSLTMSANLLGTSIYELQSSLTGPEELKQANYALQSLSKGLKFLHAVPPSESPKVMGLMCIHDPDAFYHFGGITYCSWCRKGGQNEGTVVNHLLTIHHRLGLVCSRCYSCLSTASDTLCCFGWHDCHQLREGITSKSVSSN